MSSLSQRILDARPEPGAVALFWLAQAGFAFKTYQGRVLYLDPYLSDVVERNFGFKRMMPAPLTAEEVQADAVLCTHEHLDHMDTDAIPVIARNTRAVFAGPAVCLEEFAKLGIPQERCVLLEKGKTTTVAGVKVTGVYADHGEYSPGALGLVLDFDGVRIYHTGDTAYRPEQMKAAAGMGIDALLPCINGAYGNMDSHDAAQLARDAAPRTAIASHFWMFVEHGGDPAKFLEECRALAPAVEALVMKPGEMRTFARASARAAV